MGTETQGIINRLSQPEYTGENRCMPCTLVNVAITLTITAALMFVWPPLAVGLLVVGIATIYLRGYLVPKTPALTRRFFPNRVLRWFDKAPNEEAPIVGAVAELDPEPVLLDAGVVDICMGGEDLCATDAFIDAWREEIRRLRSGGDQALSARLADLLDTPTNTVRIEDNYDGILVRGPNRAFARWESRPALLADAAAVPELRRRIDSWDELDFYQIGRLLNGVRVFLEQCPSCEANLTFSEETQVSCCRPTEVIALECPACESVLLEVNAED